VALRLEEMAQPMHVSWSWDAGQPDRSVVIKHDVEASLVVGHRNLEAREGQLAALSQEVQPLVVASSKWKSLSCFEQKWVGDERVDSPAANSWKLLYMLEGVAAVNQHVLRGTQGNVLEQTVERLGLVKRLSARDGDAVSLRQPRQYGLDDVADGDDAFAFRPSVDGDAAVAPNLASLEPNADAPSRTQCRHRKMQAGEGELHENFPGARASSRPRPS